MNQSRFSVVVFIAVLFISYTTGHDIKLNLRELNGKTIYEKPNIHESENWNHNDHSNEDLPQTQKEEYLRAPLPTYNISQIINSLSQLKRVEPIFQIRGIHPDLYSENSKAYNPVSSGVVEIPYYESSLSEQMDNYIENRTSKLFYSTDKDSTENSSMVELVPGSGFKVNKSLIVEIEQDFQSIKEKLQQHLLQEFQNPDTIARLMLLSEGGASKSVEDVSDSVKEYVNEQVDKSYTVFVEGLLDHIRLRQNEIKATTVATTTTTTTSTEDKFLDFLFQRFKDIDYSRNLLI